MMQGFTMMRRHVLAVAMGGALAGMLAMPAQAQQAIRVAMGDIASVETLGLLIAMERAKERGVPMELTFFNSEDVATQAVVGGQADIGVGAPYAFIQNSRAPLRMFYRMSTLLFFPVVNTDHYTTWADLDGQEVTVHSRGSGTEALMRLMESQHGITYSAISYVPGAEVRTGAMLQGTINASIVDSSGFRLLEEQGGGKFARLPLDGVNATDEALYGNERFLNEREADVAIFVEELLRTWTDINENPEMVAELRTQYDLLPDLPAAGVDDITPYYVSAAENGVMPLGGGTTDDVADDLAFLAAAGQVQPVEGDVDTTMFWDFDILTAARD
ncbi:ABC transporter substrate-binding protein [Ketogulonicigenium vulgare]|uniref:SsuA/THI5-like domain-containing protein n=1 Tax=Ketogulonicigenium vulgare (strain WSH-001) TaxID=759362 RepID=F9Y837_KETVW|nr:ABC transporter substrate-binding protein [Ketogulonicigenium vulgare]ADO42980.1 ABC transporter substrate-binding protein, putative [Ketogulonicigenium vulgare Y25]AEM41163.1 hypothetical protein KVU_1324 [Ketogulonicigenium vulgare WSH-001]ALJ81307.1 nitrate ABC transporter substrate-binding protein [Ketogulonicigenium vulgare]ANW34042.1 nitrate ABC transporter substrate-binding protein [Ketogulonicigenium vulgare]AOZ54890.1 ABC transporter substrate-binding protein [Ketogulonicigenium vu